MDHGLRRMGQRPHPRPAVQSTVSADIAPDLGRRHREVPLFRHDPGRSPVYAKKLVRAFGDKVFDIIEATPDRLREVDGIGPVRAGSILAAWTEQKAVREIMVFLHSHGVGTARAVRIFKRPMVPMPSLVTTENPYRLARDIRGIGFKTADAIAMKLGIEKTAMIRVRAGISYALTEAMDEGHYGLPTEECREMEDAAATSAP
jgi:exodeoxyribonuclease V alpha subunit